MVNLLTLFFMNNKNISNMAYNYGKLEYDMLKVSKFLRFWFRFSLSDQFWSLNDLLVVRNISLKDNFDIKLILCYFFRFNFIWFYPIILDTPNCGLEWFITRVLNFQILGRLLHSHNSEDSLNGLLLVI